MTDSPARQTLMSAIRALGWMLAAALFAELITIPLDVDQQLIFSAVLVVLAVWLRRRSDRLTGLVMMALSLLISSRYMWWRLSSTLEFRSPLEAFLGIGLVLAEFYAFVVLVLGYFQVLWPLQRRPVAMPAEVEQWPTVDVFIPTYNEPLSVVRTTVMAAMVLDWPADKFKVFVLDDGRREEFREFCEQVGVGYRTRNDNNHAKAGNINAALGRTDGDFIAIFDCDHIPTRSFLQINMGWFQKDPKLALMQTPHYFFSPDPFERNLDTFGTVPNEGELFYGLLQDGNDLWNATFFCGSCAIIKRGPCLEVGGIATETVTEDAHTSLKLHRAGYDSAYIAIPQAAGLATESLSSHVGQRIRWARGMAQIARTDNPMLGKGLRLPQRLCYLNAMLHFFYGLPRLIYLTAPLAFLLFGAQVIHASAFMIIAFAIPHILHANLTNSRLQGRFRHLFWNEVYESVLAWYILRPTLAALINPKLGKFNVTSKGGLVEKGFFDFQIAKPYLFLMMLNVAGLVAAGLRLFYLQDAGELNTIWLNVAWTIYNLIILGASVAAASETRQMRHAHRVTLDLPVELALENGTILEGRMRNFSTGGVQLALEEDQMIPSKTPLNISLSRGDESRWLPALVVNSKARRLTLRFDQLNVEQQKWLVSCTFARADIWSLRWGNHRKDVPLRSLAHIGYVSLIGFRQLFVYAVTSVSGGLRRKPPSSDEKSGKPS